jgi:hypothetical protein
MISLPILGGVRANKNIRKNRIQQYVSEIYHIYTVMYTKEKVIDFTKKPQLRRV